ncbi:hypothetical protein [Lichenicoccus sp.]|uniref:hypothetical protein n=1 Tax=Lichenicoccus sp. TaxID=2781899 RepID=UPI003D0A1899
MSENLSDAEWQAEQTRRYRSAVDDIDRRLQENGRWLDDQNRRMLARQERSDRRVLGFIPSDLWDLWPTLILASVIGGLLGFGVSELLVHHLDLVGSCRHLG